MDFEQVASVTKNEPTTVSQNTCEMANLHTCWLYPNIVLKKKCTEWDDAQTQKINI